MRISDPKKKDLERQGYRVVGDHSAVKVCLWTKKSLRSEGTCYKQRFYGINCHRCVQMTPALPTCTLRCVWCWRDIDHTFPKWTGEADSPGEIVDGCIAKHTKLLYGFGGLDRTDMKKYKEAMEPMHFAISLAGEPTMYPHLPGLIKELKKRKISSFVVTNGTNPEVLKSLAKTPPTQLYITLPSPDEESFRRNCSPMVKDGWPRILESLRVMKSLKRKTRTTVRLTLARGRNLMAPDAYAALIRIADPLFVEVKAFVSVGFSKRRLEYRDMPTHPEIKEFSESLAKALKMKIVDEQPESRVVLLMKKDSPTRALRFSSPP